MLRLFILVLLLSVSSGLFPSKGDIQEDTCYVYVVQNRWHTGLVFRVDDLNADIWPEAEGFDGRRWVDVGWGDEHFYQADGSPVHLAARAVLWPTSSALQVFPFINPLRLAYGERARILRIPVSESQLLSLMKYVADSYIRDQYGRAQPSSVYGESRHFFRATQKYHLFRTCNTWVVNGFKEAGLPVRSFCVLNANQLFRRLSKIPGAEFE
ncbi:DUF2459 domain-containing protein [Alkalitalea saponilacus]|uniref:DUF2459 domain-containing protein n=1 Tax=Alkalitalea saponilacus TaxID=889453 RepID=A0A1T5B8T6_9BACT|nr:DUF2459 domain-containing protein [Alkalitalea saponilacus]ASB49760.1 hypothetical protein CDL62_11735 [Alkalitalea saponilacus]SKB43459.1 conserved hypothetical protein [Alkalitalea saponilacus]